MMSKARYNLKIDEDLYKKFREWCEERGLSVNAVLTLLIREIVEGRLDLAFIKKEDRDKEG